jgi:hypothetical protein
MNFDLYLVNLRVYSALVAQRHGDWTDQTLNVISICAKTAFQMTHLHPKWAKVNRGWADKHHGDEVNHNPW